MIDVGSDSEDLGTGITASTEITNELEKPEYQNYVRGEKAYEYLQQGLAPFVDGEMRSKCSELRKNKLPVPTPGCGCTLKNILPDHNTAACSIKNCPCTKNKNNRRKCQPNGYCGTFYHWILNEHRYNDPYWINTDITAWPNDDWSVAKCFMTTKCSKTSANTTDAAGLLSVIINAKFFEQKTTSPIKPPEDIFTKAREIRNNMFHRATFELQDAEVKEFIEAFIAVLQGINYPNAAKIVEKMEILKAGHMYITLREEDKYLVDRKEALRLEVELNKSQEEITILKKQLMNAETTHQILQKRIQEQEQPSVDMKALSNTTTHEETIYYRTTERNKRQRLLEEKSSEKDDETYDQLFGKVKTDKTELNDAKYEEIHLRDYQKELAAEGLNGHNVIILAPTGSGKTRVACRIIQEHFSRQKKLEKVGRVILLVEKEALAFQVGQVCAELLPAYRTTVISGYIQREENKNLKDLLDKRDIFVVTAQVLLNDLKSGDIESITLFSMLVFDECHHTTKQHSFNEIMRDYLCLKHGNNESCKQLPQVVGLTASLGAGGNKNENTAKQHMKTVMANMDAKFLCTVRDNVQQLMKFENKPSEYIKVTMPRETALFKEEVSKVIQRICNFIGSHERMRELSPVDSSIRVLCQKVGESVGNADTLLLNIGKLKEANAELMSDDLRRLIFRCCQHLKVYHNALLIYADARVKDAKTVVSEFVNTETECFKERKMAYENQEDEDLKIETFLFELNEELQAKTFDEEEENPKLLILQDIILRNLLPNEPSRGIIFVKTRKLARALDTWMNETDRLKKYKAISCVGQGNRESFGQTKNIQRRILQHFKNGLHRLIIATSVVEEGLDVSECKLVIRYEHVTTEIARLQSRGRARAKESRYYVLTGQYSWVVEKEKKNAELEELIKRIVPSIQREIKDNPKGWEEESKSKQLQRIKDTPKKNTKIFKGTASGEIKQFQCECCSALIFQSTDIRKIKDCHHIVIGQEVQDRLIFRRDREEKSVDAELKIAGKALCGNKKCLNKLGGTCIYKGEEFPMISVEKYRVVDIAGKGKAYKKWKNVGIVVMPYEC